MHQQYQLKQSC